ncbi:hypothetical protein BDW71DRAFT_191973 [Aspergillus fruticulosus]
MLMSMGRGVWSTGGFHPRYRSICLSQTPRRSVLLGMQVAIVTLIQWATIYSAHLRFRMASAPKGRTLLISPSRASLCPTRSAPVC